jgi:uncharacterized membrane protein YdjX (TVP38/TMEM64 family)
MLAHCEGHGRPMSDGDRSPRSATLRALAIVAMASVLYLAWRDVVPTTHAEWHDWLARFGVFAPVVLILVQALQVVIAPIPGALVNSASGYSFGVALGTAYSLLGTMLGTFVAIQLARRYGRPRLHHFMSTEWASRLDTSARRHGPTFFFLVFLLPFLPDDLACFAAGLSSVPVPLLMLAALLGRTPSIWASCWVGAQASQLNPSQLTGLGAVSALLAILYIAFRRRVEDALSSWTRQWF